MNAAFFEPTRDLAGSSPTGRQRRAHFVRRAHRVIALAFLISVAANFIAMIWGPPPALITFAPLAPLLLLTLTGIAMFFAIRVGKGKAGS